MKVNDDRITVRSGRYNNFIMYSTSNFFAIDKELVFSIDNYGFSFSIPSIDDEEICIPRKMNEKGSCISLKSDLLRVGIYYIDKEESNEDIIRINY